MTSTGHRHDQTASLLRALTLVLFLAGAVGVVIDLGLIGHFEEAWQVAPLVLLGLSGAVGLAVAVTPSAFLVRMFRLSLLALVAGGAGGLWLHYRANLEFEREVSPDLTGLTLLWKAVRGASPPSAAPATLIHLAVLGWVGTVRHPALRSSPSASTLGGGFE